MLENSGVTLSSQVFVHVEKEHIFKEYIFLVFRPKLGVAFTDEPKHISEALFPNFAQHNATKLCRCAGFSWWTSHGNLDAR